jgi:two-component system, response regulator, stage 0 sporulation protein F
MYFAKVFRMLYHSARENMPVMKKKILIVDDEEDLTWSISKGLTRESDSLEVMCANSGHMALDILAQQSVDLMVTDIRMPGMSGPELIKKVKSIYPMIKVIIMTAFSNLENVDLNSNLPIMIIEKPFEIHELRSLINKSLHFS